MTVYVASKAKHFQMWRDFRAAGQPIISTWIDEGEVGATTNFADLWARCISEAANAYATIVYVEPGEVLKGALVEIGAALAMGHSVLGVGDFDGTYMNHPLFIECRDLEEAFFLANVRAGV